MNKIAAKAKECAYPIGTKKSVYTYPTGNPTDAYKKALQIAYGDRKGWGKQTKAGASCDVFAGTCIRASGYDKKFPRGLSEQIPYLKKHTDLWTKILPKSKSDLKAGDVIVYINKYGGHICIYAGNGYVNEAGYTSKRYGCTAKASSSYYTPSKYKTFEFFGVYRAKEVKPTMKKCIDISNWQGVVAESTFKGMKKDVPWVIIRSSYTSTKSFSMAKDKSFDKNIKNAYAAGMKIGVYHYSQAKNVAEAQAEADFVINTIRPYKSKITLPVVFDYEFGGRLSASVAKKLGKNGVLKVIDAFCEKIKKAGYTPMLYANLNTLNNYISQTVSEKYRIWVAQYNHTCDYKKPYYMWQFTSSGRVQGVGGKVDLSYIKGQEPKPHTPTTYKGKFPTLPKRGWFQKGDKGEQVKLMQKFLIWAGFSCGNAGADGEFGAGTLSAVKAFQKHYKLKVDGGFGKQCLDKAKTIKK